jgi:hypothetical protein
MERDFWDMTKAEVERYLEGAVWRMKQQAQFDYSLADLIGISVSRIMSSGTNFPQIYDVYPQLFVEEKKIEDQRDVATTNSINNFMAFAMRHNAKVKRGVEDINYDN